MCFRGCVSVNKNLPVVGVHMGLSGSRRFWFSGIEFLIVALACNSRAGSFVAAACTSKRLCSVGLCSSACLLWHVRVLTHRIVKPQQQPTCRSGGPLEIRQLRMRMELCCCRFVLMRVDTEMAVMQKPFGSWTELTLGF